MNWDAIVEAVTPVVVKIETPSGHGTGFLCLYNEPRTFCGIATAYHVVKHAEQWQEPIRITNYATTTSAFLRETDRVIFSEQEKDSAVILISTGQLNFPEEPIQLLPTDQRLSLGMEVGWLGYPAMASATLCFFAGNVSAWQDFRRAYLIDGVAINGVSGGPVIYASPSDLEGGTSPLIVGAISAYYANRATGETLPGLSIAQDVSHFHNIITQIKSWDEAEKQKQALAKQKPIEEPQSAQVVEPLVESPPVPPSEKSET
ncbi:MAG: trypsin-like peptidase domain-containing protein [Terriglobales bacterium]